MTPIYHITHLQNLPTILAQGGLWCDNGIVAQSLDYVGIAHAHIKERRAKKVVPLATSGTLADYVPFYFAPRSPMLYAIHRGFVVGYDGGQSAVLHLVSSAEAVAQAALPFGFTDGHAEMAISRFFADLADLNQIDWDIMQATYWNDTKEDGDRKRRRQAEFLVHQFFPWSLITEIGVRTVSMAKQVNTIVAAATHRPTVSVCRQWYY